MGSLSRFVACGNPWIAEGALNGVRRHEFLRDELPRGNQPNGAACCNRIAAYDLPSGRHSTSSVVPSQAVLEVASRRAGDERRAFPPHRGTELQPADEVAGTVFQLTPAELTAADAYEVSDYARVSVRLKSGLEAWVYVRAPALPS
jgi:hypothetical protein